MSETKFLKCSCAACGERIEYPADAVGQTIDCPHCHFKTELTVEVPEAALDSPAPRRSWLLWTLVLLIALGIAGALAPMLLKRALAEKRSHQVSPVPPEPTAKQKSKAAPASVVTNDFTVSPVKIDGGGQLRVYAIGSVSNMLAKQRFAVRAEVELLDAAGRTIGTASDYTAVLEPNAVWQFKALVLKGSPESARVVRIAEQ